MNPEIIPIEELERDAQRLRAEAAKIEAETRLLLASVVSVSVAALVLTMAQ